MSDISSQERAGLAQEGHALPDGSYPIRNCEDLSNAVHAYGRAPESHRRELARLIVKRDRELGCNQDLDKIREEAGE